MRTNLTALQAFYVEEEESGIISDKDFITSTYALAYVMLSVSFVGLVTNAINIKTFLSMGLDDGITVSLLGLAMSDFGFTFFGCVLSCANIVEAVEEMHDLRYLPVDPKGVFSMFSANLGYMCYQVTCMITTFMAVARCMCVAMPFQFRNYFTKLRSKLVLVAFALIALATYIPLFSQMGAQRKFDPVVNRTRVVIVFSSQRSEVKDAISLIHFVLFVFISSFVVVVCVAVMAKHLRQSAQFRHQTSTATATRDSEKESGYKLSGKELQVVRQVILICLIYTACMFPTVVYAIYRLADGDFDVGKRLNNFYFIASDIQIILELINSATTFPVYYFFNSKFRSHCFAVESLHTS